MTTSATITQYYQNILQRAPTAAELSSGASKSATELRDELANSAESKTFIDQIIRIYQAAFNRLPDVTGMQGAGGDGGWPDQLRADPTTLFTIAAGFTNSQEFLNIYNSNTVTTGFLNALYQNVLGRTPSSTEISDWFATGQTASQILIGFSNSAEFQNNTNAAVLALKQAAGDATDLSAVYAGTGSLIPSGSTFTLTTNNDTIAGTANDDTVNGIFDNSSSSTLNNGDTIDGAGGTGDALNIRVIDSASGGSSVSPQVSNVEKFVFTNQDTNSNDPFSLNFASITGESEVISKNSVAGSVTRAIGVDSTSAGMETTFGSFQVNFNGTRTGTSDAFSLALNGAGSSSSTAGFATINSSATNTDTSFEIANIASSSAESFLQFGSMTLQTVNVSGDAKLNLSETSSFAGLKTVDASGMTGGGVDVDASGSSETGFSFTGSSAADRILLTNTTINNAASFNGGDGKDTLASNTFNVTASVVNSATSFEVLESTRTSSVNASDFTGIHEFLFSGNTSNNRTNITGVETNDLFVFTADVDNGDETVRFTSQNAGNEVKFELRAQTGTGGEVHIFADTNSGNDNSAVGFSGSFSKVTINSTADGTQSAANAIYAVDNNFNHYAFANQNGPTSFVLTGDHALTIGAREGVTMSTSSDTRGFESAVNVDASAMTGVLRISGSNSTSSGDTITGGSAGDIIYGLAGSDVLTGNGGGDQFRLVGFTTNSTDRITDFDTGADMIGSNAINFGNTTASSAGAVLNSADYIENRSNITSIGSSDDNKVVELQAALSGSQIANDTGAAVEAYVLVFNSTTNKGELWYDSDWSTNSNRFQVVNFDNVTSLTGVQNFSNTNFVEFTA